MLHNWCLCLNVFRLENVLLTVDCGIFFILGFFPFQNSFTKKQYAFSYTVRDMHSGDDFSHTQQQKNGAVKGTYKVQLPDGRTQVVR